MNGIPLRVATFNTRLLPYLPSCRSRARSIAARIADQDYDLIGLSEVFSRRAKRELIDRLSPHYAYGVWNLGNGSRFRLDSGLMVLSKLALEDLPGGCESALRSANSGGAPRRRSASNVRFHEYTDRCASDGLATKGCAYVRVSIRGHPLHVFVTHVQASYLSHSVGRYLETVSTREAQIRQMAEFIRATLGAGSLAGENVLILGDFNVHWRGDGARYPHRGARLHGDEGQMMFQTLGSLFPGGLVDVWLRYGPPGNPGLTYPAADPSARPDYILLSSADSRLPLCAQQVAVTRDMAWGGTDDRGERPLLSDHLGVEAELNLVAPHSSIRDAQRIAVDGNRLRLQGRIEHPGGVQWYRLTAPGRYEIRVGGARAGTHMRTEVYLEDDMSRALVPLKGAVVRSMTVKEYAVASPSYLRVGDSSTSAPDLYTLEIRRRAESRISAIS